MKAVKYTNQDYIDFFEEFKGMIRYKTNTLPASTTDGAVQSYKDFLEEFKGMIRLMTNTLPASTTDGAVQDYKDFLEEFKGMIRCKTNTSMTSAYNTFKNNSLPIAVGAVMTGAALALLNR